MGRLEDSYSLNLLVLIWRFFAWKWCAAKQCIFTNALRPAQFAGRENSYFIVNQINVFLYPQTISSSRHQATLRWRIYLKLQGHDRNDLLECIEELQSTIKSRDEDI